MKNSTRIGLLAAVVATLAGSAAIIACSSDDKPPVSGGGDAGSDQTTPPPAPPPPPPPSDAGDGGGGGDGGDGGGLNCNHYCNIVMSGCTPDAGTAQYASQAECLAMCAKLPVGTAGDTTGNTLGCRLYHAGVAASSPDAGAIHCGHAGPYGGDVCGDKCAGFCSIAVATCGDAGFDGGCTADCANFAFDGGPYGTTYEPTSGDSLSCRYYHLRAAQTAAATHCPHIATVPNGGCQ